MPVLLSTIATSAIPAVNSWNILPARTYICLCTISLYCLFQECTIPHLLFIFCYQLWQLAGGPACYSFLWFQLTKFLIISTKGPSLSFSLSFYLSSLLFYTWAERLGLKLLLGESTLIPWLILTLELEVPLIVIIFLSNRERGRREDKPPVCNMHSILSLNSEKPVR